MSVDYMRQVEKIVEQWSVRWMEIGLNPFNTLLWLEQKQNAVAVARFVAEKATAASAMQTTTERRPAPKRTEVINPFLYFRRLTTIFCHLDSIWKEEASAMRTWLEHNINAVFAAEYVVGALTTISADAFDCTVDIAEVLGLCESAPGVLVLPEAIPAVFLDGLRERRTYKTFTIQHPMFFDEAEKLIRRQLGRSAEVAKPEDLIAVRHAKAFTFGDIDTLTGFVTNRANCMGGRGLIYEATADYVIERIIDGYIAKAFPENTTFLVVTDCQDLTQP